LKKFDKNNNVPKAPRSLSREAKRWWNRLQNEYLIEDEAGKLILETALLSFDRMREAQVILETEGMTILDRFGQKKAHPLCAVERDARSGMLQYLKALNLDVEPLRDGPGRPGGK